MKENGGDVFRTVLIFNYRILGVHDEMKQLGLKAYIALSFLISNSAFAQLSGGLKEAYQKAGVNTDNIKPATMAGTEKTIEEGTPIVLNLIWMFALVVGASFFVIGLMMVRNAAKTNTPQTAGWISCAVGIVLMGAAPIAYALTVRTKNSL